MILALALAAATLGQQAAMERCAEAVVARLHPGGMVDVTGISFEWLQISGVEPKLVIIGSIIEAEGKARVARRFTCRSRGKPPPSVSFGKAITL